MERLTDKHFNKSLGYYMKCSGNCCKEDFSCENCEKFDGLVDRLGAIEDILGDDYSLDRFRELVEADREGRCVVLKFKPDTFVYRAWPGVGKRPPFVTAHYLDTMDACIEAQLWNNAYQSDEAAEAALKGEQDEKH